MKDEFLDCPLTLYKICLKRTSDEWGKIKVSKAQTFEAQCKQGRRPRITWDALHPQILGFTCKIYEGTFDDIFTHPEAESTAEQ